MERSNPNGKRMLSILLAVMMFVTPLFSFAQDEADVLTVEPAVEVTAEPTAAPTEAPTAAPTEAPTAAPTEAPTAAPTEAPTAAPTEAPTAAPTEVPTAVPTEAPTAVPAEEPTAVPTEVPAEEPVAEPTAAPTEAPVAEPTAAPTEAPTAETAATAEPTPEVTVEPVDEPAEETEIEDKPPVNDGHTKVKFNDPVSYLEEMGFNGYTRKTDMIRSVCSDHDYEANEDETIWYHNDGANKVLIKFDNQSYVEDGFDVVGVYNENQELVAAYTGDFGGETLQIIGSGFYIRLVSDYSEQYYGYDLTMEWETPSIRDVAAEHRTNGWGLKFRYTPAHNVDGYEIQFVDTDDGSWCVREFPVFSPFATFRYGRNVKVRVRAYRRYRDYYNNICKFYGPWSSFSYCSVVETPPTVTLRSATSLANNAVEIKWDYASGYSTYYVLRSNNYSSGYTRIATVTNASKYIDNNTQSGILHYYKVVAVKGNATGAEQSVPLAGYGLSAPTFGNCYATEGGIVVQWSKIITASGYKVYRKTSSQSSYSLVATLSGRTSTKYTDADVLSSTEYAYKIAPYYVRGSVTINGPLSGYKIVKAKVMPTVWRVLAIGNGYSGSASLAPATYNDMNAVAHIFSARYPGHVYTGKNLDYSATMNAIRNAYAGATANDVSVFYFSGHGGSGGVLASNEFGSITPNTLRSMLDQVPGKKLVLIDACYSGGMIGRDAGSPADFNNAFISAFRSSDKANLAASNYFVMTASSGSQISWQDSQFGYFTAALCYGVGYGYSSYFGKPGSAMPADSSHDGKLTLNEWYTLTRHMIYNLEFDPLQTVQVYPANSNFVIFNK